MTSVGHGEAHSPAPMKIWLTFEFFFLFALVALPAVQSATLDGVPIPFRILWNYPDDKCSNHHIDLGVTKYGIIRNQDQRFMGDQISTFYTDSSGNKYGKWPFLKNVNVSQPVNGGIPQRMNMTAHLDKMLEDILPIMGANSTGYGVLDFEAWRPLLDTNYGDYYSAYAQASDAYVREQHPEYRSNEIRPAAIKDWNTGARELFVKSVETLKAARPDVHWGYYLYARTWGDRTEIVNERMSWLYKTVTGLYPSIYLYNIKTQPVWRSVTRVSQEVAEAFRVKGLYSPPGTIIAPYAKMQNSPTAFYTEEELYLAIGLAAELGVDGIILWGSSHFILGDQVENCNNIKNYVENTLGPFVMNLTETLTNCSAVRCNGRGRCVKQWFAHRYPYLLGSNPYTFDNPVPTADSTNSTTFVNLDDTPSSSKSSSTSPPSANPQSTDLTHDPLINQRSETSDNITTVDPSTVVDERASTLPAPTTSSRETSVTDDFTSTLGPSLEATYEGFMCQCYDGWGGPSCEYPLD